VDADTATALWTTEQTLREVQVDLLLELPR
jgi:hypothetical protein